MCHCLLSTACPERGLANHSNVSLSRKAREARFIELTCAHPSRLIKVEHPQTDDWTGGRSDTTPRESREVSKRSPWRGGFEPRRSYSSRWEGRVPRFAFVCTSCSYRCVCTVRLYVRYTHVYRGCCPIGCRSCLSPLTVAILAGITGRSSTRSTYF